MSANTPVGRNNDPSKSEFTDYFKSLSKEMKSPLAKIGLTTDQAIQNTIQKTFEGLGKLSSNPKDDATITIKDKEIKLADLSAKEIKVFVDFSNKYFNVGGQKGDYKNFVEHINSTSRYIQGLDETRSLNPLKNRAAKNSIYKLETIKDMIATTDTNLTANDRIKSGRPEDKEMELFFTGKEKDLNSKITHQQGQAKYHLKKFKQAEKEQVPRAIGAAVLGSVGFAMLFIPFLVPIGILFLIGGSFLLGNKKYHQAHIDTGARVESSPFIDPCVSMIHRYQSQKKKLTPEFYQFLRDNKINPSALIDKPKVNQSLLEQIRDNFEVDEGFDVLVNFHDNIKDLESRIQFSTIVKKDDKEKDGKETQALKEALEKTKSNLNKYLHGKWYDWRPGVPSGGSAFLRK